MMASFTSAAAGKSVPTELNLLRAEELIVIPYNANVTGLKACDRENKHIISRQGKNIHFREADYLLDKCGIIVQTNSVGLDPQANYTD
jgi:hypothetical protein